MDLTFGSPCQITGVSPVRPLRSGVQRLAGSDFEELPSDRVMFGQADSVGTIVPLGFRPEDIVDIQALVNKCRFVKDLTPLVQFDSPFWIDYSGFYPKLTTEQLVMRKAAREFMPQNERQYRNIEALRQAIVAEDKALDKAHSPVVMLKSFVTIPDPDGIELKGMCIELAVAVGQALRKQYNDRYVVQLVRGHEPEFFSRINHLYILMWPVKPSKTSRHIQQSLNKHPEVFPEGVLVVDPSSRFVGNVKTAKEKGYSLVGPVNLNSFNQADYVMKKDSYDGWIAQDMLFGISVGRVSEFLNEPWQKGDADIQALKHRLEQNELPDPMVYLTFTPFGATLRLQMPGTARHTHWASITPGYEALFSDFRHPLVYLKYKCDDVFRQYMRTVGTRKSHAPDPEENKRLWNDLQDMWVPPEKRMSQPPWEI